MTDQPTKVAETELAEKFCQKLLEHAKRKAAMYDGMNKRIATDTTLRYATEELGEVATAITRERWLLAKAECFDLAHTAFLVYLALEIEHPS